MKMLNAQMVMNLTCFVQIFLFFLEIITLKVNLMWIYNNLLYKRLFHNYIYEYKFPKFTWVCIYAFLFLNFPTYLRNLLISNSHWFRHTFFLFFEWLYPLIILRFSQTFPDRYSLYTMKYFLTVTWRSHKKMIIFYFFSPQPSY